MIPKGKYILAGAWQCLQETRLIGRSRRSLGIICLAQCVLLGQRGSRERD